MLQQINRDMADQVVHPVERLVQRVRERLGAGEADDQCTHQARSDRYRNTVDFRQIDVRGCASALQRRHHRLQVSTARHLWNDAAEPYVQLDAGRHLVGQQLVPPDDADPGLVAGGLDANNERAADGPDRRTGHTSSVVRARRSGQVCSS